MSCAACDRARELLEEAAAESERLGVPHLAEEARSLAGEPLAP